jgi:hypothetical protein
MRFFQMMALVSLVVAGGCSTRPALSARDETPAAFDVSVASIESRQAAAVICPAAAEARQANWTGLFWTPSPGGPSMCALTPRTHGAADPIMLADSCFGDPSGPHQCSFLGQTPETVDRVRAAVRERPDPSARVVGHIAPTESFVIVEFLFVTHFSHRGVLRSAWGAHFPAGQIVFPFAEDAAPYEEGGATYAFPWTPNVAPGRRHYELIAYPQRVLIDVYSNQRTPDIEWTPLPPVSKFSDTWVLVRGPDGSMGWANDDELRIDYGLDGDE